MRDLTQADLATWDRDNAESAIRSRVQTVYLGGGRVLCRVLGYQKLFLSTQDIGFSCHVMLDGYWEIWLTQFFARYLRPGMTLIDVGANLGYYTIMFGGAVGPTGRVLAVEPVPATAEMLSQSILLNGYAGYTTLARVALGRNPEGQSHLRIIPNEPKNASVVSRPGLDTILVPTTNLDTLARHLHRIDLIKIDAEGSEIEIFEGMQKIIDKHAPAVLLEFNANRYDDAQRFLGELRRKFASIRAIDYEGLLQPSSDHALLDSHPGEDWLLFLEVA